MYVLIAGGGKAGANVMRTLLRNGHEATLIEQDRERFERLEREFEHQAMLGDAGRVLVRRSGTEPLVRVMVEAPDRARCAEIAGRLAEVVERDLG